MKIYFAAHATTTDNEKELSSGWKDVELSELGIKQAKELKNSLKDIKFDLICCSDLKRAVDTVEIAFGELPMIINERQVNLVKPDKRLRELNYGNFNGKPASIVGPMKIQKIKKPFPNGENYEQAMERTHEFYKELKKNHSDKNILVIGHRATQYGLDTLINGKTIEECLKTPFKWQSYWEYNFS